MTVSRDVGREGLTPRDTDRPAHSKVGTILEEVGPGDQFGTALGAWNFGGGTNPDLAIGAPFDDIGDPIEPTAAERT
jgi:hypothetical protein